MSSRKDISSDLRQAVVAAHQSGDGYQAKSKSFGVSHFTVRNIIQRQCENLFCKILVAYALLGKENFSRLSTTQMFNCSIHDITAPSQSQSIANGERTEQYNDKI